MTLPDPVVPIVLDRLYAINQTITGVSASRYYPQTKREKLITALPGPARHESERYGVENVHTIRNYTLVLWVRNFLSGAIGTTAQREAESLIDTIAYEYWQRPRLELAIQNEAGVTVWEPLDVVMQDARITADASIAVEDDLAVVRYTLPIETVVTIRRR